MPLLRDRLTTSSVDGEAVYVDSDSWEIQVTNPDHEGDLLVYASDQDVGVLCCRDDLIRQSRVFKDMLEALQQSQPIMAIPDVGSKGLSVFILAFEGAAPLAKLSPQLSYDGGLYIQVCTPIEEALGLCDRFDAPDLARRILRTYIPLANIFQIFDLFRLASRIDDLPSGIKCLSRAHEVENCSGKRLRPIGDRGWGVAEFAAVKQEWTWALSNALMPVEALRAKKTKVEQICVDYNKAETWDIVIGRFMRLMAKTSVEGEIFLDDE